MMIPDTIRTEYERRLARWRDEAGTLARRLDGLGTLRLLLFFATLGAAVWVLRSHPAFAAWLLVPVALFAVLVVLHARLAVRRQRALRGAGHHERNLARLDGRWTGLGPTGEEGLPDTH
ncbi:MAG TPA: hypothetical protein VK824_03170, partial [Planctomycetota bacterium]|nr:hypothetical protein [Planctomycetota bacterium]